MTRRLAMLLLGGLVQNLLPKQRDTLVFLDKQPPNALVIPLDQWTEWRISYQGETVTFTAAEMFAALKDGR